MCTTRCRLPSRSVVVLDEAGAVGLESMAKLFELAVRRDFRVVLCGDTGQHSSVSRGDALRILERSSGYRFEELTTIRRQKPAAFRQVVELAAAKQTDKAFAKLLELGAVTEALTDDGKLYQRAADAYLSATKQGRSALLVSPTWAEIEAVTDKVRDTLKAQGVLGQQEEAVTVFDSLSWTEAQKKNASQFVPGQRLRFVRQTKHFDRGDTVEVVATVENGLRVRRPNGTEVNFMPASAASPFDVGEARELRVAAGDWLLLQANHGKEFINGERVQVREIQAGRIALADGRVLPTEFNAFTHGYAVTSHSSQSKTVDEVLLVASSKSFAAVNREQFYVSISRGDASGCGSYTDDAELLGPPRRPTRARARPPSSCRRCAMAWPNSVSSARNGWKKKCQCMTTSRRCPRRRFAGRAHGAAQCARRDCQRVHPPGSGATHRAGYRRTCAAGSVSTKQKPSNKKKWSLKKPAKPSPSNRLRPSSKPRRSNHPAPSGKP